MPPVATSTFYPERPDQPQPAADRLLAGFGFRLRALFARRLRGEDQRATDVRAHADRFRDTPLAPRLTELRYSLRRDGFGPRATAECYAWYCAALVARNVPPPAAHVLGAADRLIAGGMVELADPRQRLQALGLAAAAFAAHGTPVHVICGSDARALQVGAALEPVFSLLGLAVASVAEGMPVALRREAYALPVVCAAQRQIASDYLQDHLNAGRGLRRLSGRIGSLAGDGRGKESLLLRGLSCALVDEADWVMLDDAASPVVITAEADRSGERLVYEQALEFARALEQDAEFKLDERGAALTGAGAERMDRLLAPLGGAWAGRERRRQLVETALTALHAQAGGRDYRVEDDRVIFPEGAGADEDLRAMVELKEGCRLGAQRNVLARLVAPRLLRRYLHLAGVCADARGRESEIWSMYSLQTTLAGHRGAAEPIPVRVFATGQDKREALLSCIQSAGERGEAVLLALRSAREAQALAAALQERGVQVTPLREAAQLDRPGGVALVVHPAENRFPAARRKTALRLIFAELHDSRRHLERIRNAFAADACDLLISLQDEALTQLFGGATLGTLALGAGGELPAARSRWVATLALRRTENAHGRARDEALSREQYLSELLSFSGSRD